MGPMPNGSARRLLHPRERPGSATRDRQETVWVPYRTPGVGMACHSARLLNLCELAEALATRDDEPDWESARAQVHESVILELLGNPCRVTASRYVLVRWKLFSVMCFGRDT